MGYAHIENLYKNQLVLKLFKRCYALEKIHGTSAHISYDGKDSLTFYSGGESMGKFMTLFNVAELTAKFQAIFGTRKVTVYGEAYGGSQQKMAHTYGPNLKFIVFDVQVTDLSEEAKQYWMDVPNAADVAAKLGLEFVHYEEIPCELEAIDAQRDAPSVQAVRNGITDEPKKREGVVLRPLFDISLRGARVCAKHKIAQFGETATPRTVDEHKLRVLHAAEEIAREWVTPNRIANAKSHFPPEEWQLPNMRNLINYVVEDVLREGKDEIVDTPEVRAMLTKTSAQALKKALMEIPQNG